MIENQQIGLLGVDSFFGFQQKTCRQTGFTSDDMWFKNLDNETTLIPYQSCISNPHIGAFP